MTGCIVGWSHSKFGKLDDRDLESLIVSVATEAIHDAGLEPADIDQIFLGTFNVEKMTTLSSREVGDVLVKASYVKEEASSGMSFPGIFGHITDLYFQRYGDQSDALAMIAAKNHANGAVNPLAHMQKDFGYDFCRTESDKNPFVAGPLKRTDCSMISDGAAAVVLTNVETALGMKKAVAFRAAQQVNDYLPMSTASPAPS